MSQASRISRRDFTRISMSGLVVASAGALYASYGKSSVASPSRPNALIMGAPVEEDLEGPDAWVRAHRQWGYGAAYAPVDADAPEDEIKAYAQAAEKAGLIIAEVGAWSNPISPDDEERREAIKYCTEQLALADRIGARCCVNVAGSRGDEWAGPHPDNLTEETYDLIVETIRKIIDDANPSRSYFTLETMPWIHPNSPETYARLLKDMDRKHFAAHLDPVNMVNGIDRYYNNTELIKRSFKLLGPRIKSCHAKDVVIKDGFPVHIVETRPGTGALDYKTYLSELSKLDEPPPLMLEHLETLDEYRQARDHIRSVAKETGLSFA